MQTKRIKSQIILCMNRATCSTEKRHIQGDISTKEYKIKNPI